MGLSDAAGGALAELGAVFGALAPNAPERLGDELLAAGTTVVHGVGREGLMMRALCMRLGHLGFAAHVAGDMTVPPIGKGDLLVSSAGPGAFSTVLALQDVAARAGARRAVITAQPAGEAAGRADLVVHLPAQTMADDRPGVLPMGSLYEIAQLVFFDLLCLDLQQRTGQAAGALRARHTNLE